MNGMADLPFTDMRTARGDARHRREMVDGGIGRMIDIVGAVAIIVFLFPVLMLVAFMVFATDPGPVLFAHQRFGKGGRTFFCLKFRTMALNAEAQLQELLAQDPVSRAEWSRDHKLRNDPRVTFIGNFLRRSSLDELPQLFNVLRGEMSLVGPRPIVALELTRYGRYIEYYFRVRPGITGLWQISGRNNTTYRRRVAIDVVYSKQKNPVLDARILLLTLPCVAFGKGAY